MSQKLRSFHFRPALLDSLKHYRRPDFMADLGAGQKKCVVSGLNHKLH